MLMNGKFRGLKRCLLTIMALLAGTGFLLAQQVSVSGIVTASEDGAPLPGVTVLEKGTTNGTITDIDGKYRIEVSQNAVISFSFIGMQTYEMQVTSSGTGYNVVLEPETTGLNEVVVTALGIKRETKKIGYAVTEVQGDEIAAVNTVGTVQALQGKAAGVSIGTSDGGLFGNSKIQVRGVSVLNSNNNQPIFVVDGVILDNGVTDASADWSSSSNDFGNQLKNLNPDDYESISILKGAAATALYGSRGINGAVVIKTKDGRGSQGLGIKITQSFGIDHVYDEPDFQYEFGPGAIAGYTDYGDQAPDGGYYRFSTNQFYTNDEGIPTKQGHPWYDTGYGPKFDGREMIDYDGKMTTYRPVKDHMKKAYDTGFNSNTFVSISKGDENSTFYLSDSYNYRTGVLPSDKFTRNSLKFAGTHNVSGWLTAEASISLTTSEPQNPDNDLAEHFIDGTWGNWYDPDKWNKREVYQAFHGGVSSTQYGDEYGYVPGNSIWFSYNLDREIRKEQVVRPIVSLTANLTDWLTIKAEGNMNHYTYSYEKKQMGQGYANEGGYYEMKHYKDFSKTGKLTATITKKLTNDISSSLLVGGEIWKQEKSYTRVWTNGGLIVPNKFFIENSKEDKGSEGVTEGTKQINSLYFLANFGWKDQLFLDITGRNDWSSSLVYTDGTGNYSYFYPSVSTSWLFNETFGLPAWISFAKLRLSWAQVGNDTEPYLLNKGYSLKTYELSNSYVYSNSKSTTIVDPNVEPEKKNSYEAGLDIRFFKNRLGFDFTVYREKINHQIGYVPIPQESGVDQLMTNVGTLKNSGVELTVNGTPVKSRNFQWDVTFNYWDNTTKITKLHKDYGAYKVLGGNVDYGNYRIGSVAYEGGEYGVLMSDSKPLEWEGASDDPNNGKKILNWSTTNRGAFYKRSGNVQKVGSIQPDFEGSLSSTFRYKNLTFSFMLDARFGGYIASYPNRYGTAYGWLKTSLRGRDAEHGGITWTSTYADTNGQTFEDGVIPDGVFAEGQTVTAPDGSTVDVGGMTYEKAYENGYVEPTHASYNTYFNNSWSSGVVNKDWFDEVRYIALRNISIGYNLPKSFAYKIKAQNLYVALNARNLGYLYNSLPNHMNPEGFRGTTSSASFFQRTIMPYTATYTMTFSIDF